MKEYSIILPAYNESSSLEGNVDLLDDFMQKLGSSYEIIIAEDGSTDKTYPIAKELAERKLNVKVIHSKEQLGKGAALTRAIMGSEGQTVVFMDADLAVDLKNLDELLRSVEQNCEVVVGSRLIKGSTVKRPPLRSLTSRIYNICANILFRDGICDHQCGLKGFQRQVAAEVLPQMHSTGWVWDTEFLLRTIKAGYTVHEIPVSWHERRGKTSIKAFRLAPIMVFELLKLWVSARARL
ncbi:glycosyltransferase [Candidatus Bathyarchaeota archaeon]|nr:glycosyltransferase [Candidatus Bathyarchaeota archaeon]